VSVDDARRSVENARTAGVFPAASVEVGSSADVLWSEAFGTSLHTPFDLASLTKAVATTTVVMELVRAGSFRLEEPVSTFFGEWRGADRQGVTVRDLLEHASGLPARLVDAPPLSRREFEHDICTMALEYRPRTKSVYSDLGFILLGCLAADRGGAPLSELFDRVMVRLKPDTTEGKDGDRDSGRVRLQPDLLTFGIPPALRHLAAPTRPMAEDSRRGRDLVGEVHDNYAAALGGVAGHAGLFATASGVGAFARVVMRALRGDADVPPPFSRDLVRQFVTKSTVPGSSRALGWDTMLTTSSCGTKMSTSAFGHVGFTGTSLWIDPLRDRYFVLLTNRVLGGGTLDEMRTMRRAFHDALGDV
jgi:CubicO group peptidase (beta-lactamase class C family)